jgi:hypothetical protein
MNSLMITKLDPIVYEGQIYLSIYKCVLWCSVQISCVHTFMVNYLYIKLVVVCCYCSFKAFLIIWADNLCKLNSISQATIPFVKINMTPVGYSFCGAVQFSNRWYFVVSFDGFPPGTHCFLKSSWSIHTQAWRTEAWNFRVSNTLYQWVEWFCLYLESATCLVHVSAFIPANNVNESIITYILGCGFPDLLSNMGFRKGLCCIPSL